MGIIAKNLTYGAGSITTDGLVLYYDPKNETTYTPSLSKNFHPNPTDIFAWSGSTGLRCTLSRDTISSPVGNKPLKMVVTGNDPYTETFNTSTWNNISSASIGQTWTVSVWAKASVATTGQIFIFEANSSGAYIAAPALTINITTEWQRFSYTYTFTNPSTRFIQTRLDGPDSGGSGVTVWWDGLQVELSNEVTGFTTSYPVTNSTIEDLSPSSKSGTLTGPIFDGTSFDFNGTTNSLTFTSFGTSISNNFSYEFWCMPRLTHQIDPESINGSSGTSGQAYIAYPNNFGTFPGAGISVGTNGISVYEHANDYMPAVLVYSSTISNTRYSHIVVTYTNKQSRLYLNGNLVKTGLTSPYSTVYFSGSSIGSGNYGGFTGLIGMVRYYNKPLSLDEVQKNFKAHRGRFNI